MINMPINWVTQERVLTEPFVLPGTVQLNRTISEYKTLSISIAAMHSNGTRHIFTRRIPLNQNTLNNRVFVGAYDTFLDIIDLWVDIHETSISLNAYYIPEYWAAPYAFSITLNR